jgi:hypothetical protein
MRFMEFKQSIKEEQEVSYDNWDHDYPVEYSEYLEKTFGEAQHHTMTLFTVMLT